MEEERICALCGEILADDDEGRKLKDGRIVCEDCIEYSCGCCDECGEYVEEDDLTNWGDDMSLCPDCFSKYFPDFDEKKNMEETAGAYEAMLKRLVGRKTDQEEGTVEIETDMNEDSFKYSIEVTIDGEGKISDISRYSISRCRAIWETGEDWLDYPVDPDDYEKDGPAENLIRSEIVILDEED